MNKSAYLSLLYLCTVGANAATTSLNCVYKSPDLPEFNNLMFLVEFDDYANTFRAGYPGKPMNVASKVKISEVEVIATIPSSPTYHINRMTGDWGMEIEDPRRPGNFVVVKAGECRKSADRKF